MRQIAKRLGYVMANQQTPEQRLDAKGWHGRLWCFDCGREMPGNRRFPEDRLSWKRCPSCIVTPRICDNPECGKLFYQQTHELLSHAASGPVREASGRASYSGAAFCGKPCFGSVMGKKHGWGNHRAEMWRQNAAAIQEAIRAGRETASAIAEGTGMPWSTVNSHLRMMMASGTVRRAGHPYHYALATPAQDTATVS